MNGEALTELNNQSKAKQNEAHNNTRQTIPASTLDSPQETANNHIHQNTMFRLQRLAVPCQQNWDNGNQSLNF
jgi:single-stranded DNA-specific DHH superfamily exonuclease